jgi:hypothetical protein
VKKYLYSHRDANGIAQGVTLVRTYPYVTWFGASYLNASQVPDVNAFVKANVTSPIVDKLVYMGEPEVYGGNRLVVIDMAVGVTKSTGGKVTISDPIQQSLALVPGTFPKAQAVMTTYTPQHDPLTIDCTTFTFQQGLSGSVSQGSAPTCGQTSGGNAFVATDANYIGPYTLTPSAACAQAGISITPVGGTGGPSAKYAISTSNALAPGQSASCSVAVLTTDPNISGSVNVAVVATPTPPPAPTPTPTPGLIPPGTPPPGLIPPGTPPPGTPPPGTPPPGTPPPGTPPPTTCSGPYDAYGFRSCQTNTTNKGSFVVCTNTSPSGITMLGRVFVGTVTTSYEVDTPTGPTFWTLTASYAQQPGSTGPGPAPGTSYSTCVTDMQTFWYGPSGSGFTPQGGVSPAQYFNDPNLPQ